jgi:hypothetical protein
MNHWVDTKTARLLRQKEDLLREVKKLEEKFLGKVNVLGESFARDVDRLRSDFVGEVTKISVLCTDIGENTLEVQRGIEAYKSHVDRKSSADARRLAKTVKDLEFQLETAGEKVKKDSAKDLELSKAKTIAIFDSILFNISNWSTHGDTAPDFELASQSVLFPIVYERVMKGDSDYILEDIPSISLEVVRRGREYVRHFRESCPLSLLDSQTWEAQIGMVKEWWATDALPLMYGEWDPQWEEDAPFSREEMISWRDYPASRALSYPLVFDAMECFEKYRDSVRKEINLQQFNKIAMETRLGDSL